MQCKIEKDIDCFYNRKSAQDKRNGRCKICKREYDKKWRAKNKEKIAAINIMWRNNNKEKDKTLHRRWKINNRKRTREHSKKYRLKTPHKTKAHNRIVIAIRNGSIIRPKKCEVCNKKAKTQGHHWSYAKPLEVLWCCRHCHKAIHKK